MISYHDRAAGEMIFAVTAAIVATSEECQLPPSGRGRGRVMLYDDAEAAAPTTPTEASDSSVDAIEDPAYNVYVEVTMRRGINGEQLGRTVVYNVTRGKKSAMR